MKKVKVNKEACIGCGACVAIDPDHFDFDDNGLSGVISNTNLETEELQNAIGSCPTGAISIIDEECKCKDDCDCDDCNCGTDCNCTEGEECHCEGHCECCKED